MSPLSIATIAVALAVAEGLSVNRTTLWCVVADASPPAVSSSLKDFSRDWYMAMGAPPDMSYSAVPEMWNGQTILVFDIDSRLPSETFEVTANATVSDKNFTQISIIGADPLGLAYGIYYVSENWLQVDPWWWFIDAPSRFIGSVQVPDTFQFKKQPRVFAHAGWFLNDEEMAAQARADISGGSVFDPTYVDRVCETILRLGGNLIIVESFGLVDESSFLSVEKRGITLAQHHVTPVGLNVYAWPAGVPYSYRLNPRLFHFTWRALIEYQVQLQPKREVIFSVGMRGLWDSSFWEYDPYVTTDKQKGALISWAAGNQSDFINATAQAAGRPVPKQMSYTWMELLQLKDEGYLKLPDGVKAVWADGGYGFIRGWQNASEGDGLYTHAMMLNENANQISEMVPPRRAFQQLSQMKSRNATSYAIINTSDNLPAMLGIEAYMRYLWDAGASWAGATKGSSVREDRAGASVWQTMQDEYIQKWVGRYFPADNSIASDITTLYSQYYNISWMRQEDPDAYHLGDDGLAVRIGTIGGALEAWVASQSGGIDPSAAKEALSRVMPSIALVTDMQLVQVPSIEKRLYDWTFGKPTGADPDTTAWRMWRAHASLQPAVQYGLANALVHASNATLVANASGSNAAILAHMEAGIQSLDDLLETMRQAGGLSGPLRGYFQYDQFTFVASQRQLLYSVLMHLKGTHAAPVAKDHLGNPDVNIYGFECARHSAYGCKSFPFHFYNETVAWDQIVRAFCQDDAPLGPNSAILSATAGSLGEAKTSAMGMSFETSEHLLEDRECKSSWTGGTYKGASTTVVLFVARPGVTIFYTSNGSDPVPGQPGTSQYIGSPVTPIKVTGQTTLTYQAFIKNELGSWTGLAVPVVTYWDNGQP